MVFVDGRLLGGVIADAISLRRSGIMRDVCRYDRASGDGTDRVGGPVVSSRDGRVEGGRAAPGPTGGKALRS